MFPQYAYRMCCRLYGPVFLFLLVGLLVCLPTRGDAASLTAVTLSASPPSPQPVGSAITLTATPTGGTNVEYFFRAGYLWNGITVWTTLRNYSAVNTCTVTLTTPRAYTLSVRAREKGSIFRYVSAEIPFTITASPPPVSVAITPTAATVQPEGTQTFTATVTGSTNTAVTWRVREGAAGGAVTSAGVYTAPAAPGTYHVEAVSVADPTAVAAATVTVPSGSAGGLQGVSLAATPPSPQPVGTAITLTATPTGGTNVAYRFRVGYLANGNMVWNTLRDYSTVNTHTSAPGVAGEYTLSVWAREADSTQPYDVSAEISYTVSVLSSVSVTIAPTAATVQPGGTQTFTATVTGSTNTAVTWSVLGGAAGGAVTSAGVYTAPATTGTYYVQAASVIAPDSTATATVTVTTSAPSAGKIAFISRKYGNPEVLIMNPDGSDQRRVTNTTAQQDELAMSPDGSKITFISNRNGNWDLYVINIDGTNEKRLTTSNRHDWRGKYHPDGSKIIFFRTLNGRDELFLMDAGGGNERQLTNTREGSILPQYTPDGSQIVFGSYRNFKWDIYIMNADGTNQRPIIATTNYDYYHDISPDGTKIVWCHWDRIGIANIDGTNKVQLTFPAPGTKDYHPCFSPDGQYIAFASNRTGNEDIFVMKIDGSDVRNITNTPWDEWFPSWGPAYP